MDMWHIQLLLLCSCIYLSSGRTSPPPAASAAHNGPLTAFTHSPNRQLTSEDKVLARLGYSHTLAEIIESDQEGYLRVGFRAPPSTPKTDVNRMRQQFVLAILLNIHGNPLEQELATLGQTIDLDEQLYNGAFDEDMVLLLQSMLDGRTLAKGQSFNAFDTVQLQQMQGLRKLLARANTFSLFKSLACFARLHLHEVLFVNAFLLALSDRADTRQLVVPKITEIIPDAFLSPTDIEAVASKNISLSDLMEVPSGSKSKQRLADLQGGGAGQPNMRAGRVNSWALAKRKRSVKKAFRMQKKDVKNLLETDIRLGDLTHLLSRAVDERIIYLSDDFDLQNFWYQFALDILAAMRPAVGQHLSDAPALRPSAVQRCEQERRGELFLRTLQQILARIDLEKLSHLMELELGRNQATANATELSKDCYESALQQLLNGQAVDPTGDRLKSKMQVFEKLLIERIDAKLSAAEWREILEQRPEHLQNVVGAILLEQLSEMQGGSNDLFKPLRDIIDAQELSQFGRQLGNPIAIAIIKSVVETVNNYSRKLRSYSRDELAAESLLVEDIHVDRLETFCDVIAIDLTNLLRLDSIRGPLDIKKPLLGRQIVLNHREFRLDLTITSKLQQEAVVRVLLGPKLSARTAQAAESLNAVLKNFILIDAFIVDLMEGTNVVTRHPNDMQWMTADATTYLQLYKDLLLGTKEAKHLVRKTKDNCHYPQRLLLPRGLPAGLPIQLLTIVMPKKSSEWSNNVQHCGLGTASLGLDHLPLAFPFDRTVGDWQGLLAMPNVLLKDERIYHDDSLEKELLQ